MGHNSFEFLLDFGQRQEGAKEPRLHSRIVTNPVYAKAFHELLKAAIDNYEASYGTIRTPPEGGIETRGSREP